ncbi:MAG: hypothetical protein ACP5NF_09910 [Thermoanaerobaculum sp.]
MAPLRALVFLVLPVLVLAQEPTPFPEPPRPRDLGDTRGRPQWVRWERSGSVREGNKRVGVFFYSAKLSDPAEENPDFGEPRFARLLLEVTDKGGQTARVAFYQEGILLDSETQKDIFRNLFVDPDSGLWVSLDSKAPATRDEGEAPRGKTFLRVELPGWRSPWLEWDHTFRDTTTTQTVAELASGPCRTVAQVLAALPAENEAYPDYFRIGARPLLKICGLEASDGDPSRVFKVEESRVARGEKRNTSLDPDLEKRFGKWARFGELPVKLSPLK